MSLFNKIIKSEKKEEKRQLEEDKIVSNNFIAAYEELCKEYNRQLVPMMNYQQNGITLSLTTAKIKEDHRSVLKEV